MWIDLTIMNPGQLGRLEEGPEVTYSRTAWRSKGRDAVFRAVDHVLTELIVRYWTPRGGFLSKHMKVRAPPSLKEKT